jgi:capsular polysaccharide biosynthesis protein
MYLQILWKKWWIVLAAFITTIVAVSLFTLNQAPTYRASATYIVNPAGGQEDLRDRAAVLEMLSRREEIAGTYAEVANSRFIKQQAVDELGLSSAQRRDLSVDSQVMAGTNILEITVEGSDPLLVQIFTDMVGTKTATYVEELYEAFVLKPLDMASLPSSPVGPSRMINLILGGILGLALGAGLAFLAHYLEPPAGAAARQVIPAGDLASVAQMRREGSESLAPALAQAPERMVLTGTSRRSGVAFRRRVVGWIVAGVLALVLIAGGLAAWLSGRETSAAVLPEVTPLASLMATATWTSTATALPTDAAVPTATLCAFPSGWLVYAVQEGDTLLSLAASYGVSGIEIIEANCLPGDDISEFQTLRLPPLPETPTFTPTPSVAVTVTPTSSRTPRATATPNPTETSTPSPTETNAPSPTQTSTPSPTASPSKPSPTPTKDAATGTLMPAPKLLTPLDRQDFGENDEVVLAWEPVGKLPVDSYYAVTVAYSHNGTTWYDDVPWTQDTSWTLSEHVYLLDLSEDGLFRWSVQVVRQTGLDAEGKPLGEPLGAPSEVRTLTWRRASSGGGPTLPPPLPPP